jgi:hypothetical protein
MTPKAVPCPSPVTTTSFDSSVPWVSDRTIIKPIPAVSIVREEVLVEPLAWSQGIPSLRGLVGTVIESRYENLPVGSLVAGIAGTGQLTNRFISHGRCLVQISAEVANANLARDLSSILVAGLLLDRRHARTTKTLRILIPEPEAIAVVPEILQRSSLLCDVGVGTPSQDDGFDLIILDSVTDSEHPQFSSWLDEGGRMLIWDIALRETNHLDKLFTTGLQCYCPNIQTRARVITPHDILATSTPTPVELPQFKENKAYILLGGASDLGVATALWMYQVNSRPLRL